MEESKIAVNLLIRKGLISREEIRNEAYRLREKFKFKNVFTKEELEKIKKAILDYLANTKGGGWAAGVMRFNMRQFAESLEDRYCYYCWHNLRSCVYKAGLKDPVILEKIEKFINDPKLKLLRE